MADLPTQADFDAMYTGTPPWDIGRPQGSLRAVADAGGLTGRVLDAGCGTGEHALMAAALGLDATGIDGSPRAIDLARHKAAERGLAARFLLADALDLASLGDDLRNHLGANRNPTKERIFIRADKEVLYGDFMGVMNMLQDNGFYSVALVGEDKRK